MKLKFLIPLFIIFLIGCGGEPPHLENTTLQFEKVVYLGKYNSLMLGDSYRFKIITRDSGGYLSVKEIWTKTAQVVIDGKRAFVELSGVESGPADTMKANTILIHLRDKSDIDFSNELK